MRPPPPWWSLLLGRELPHPTLINPFFSPDFSMTLQGDFEGETEGDAILRTFFFLRQWKQHLQIDEIRYDWSSWIKMIKWLIIVTPPKTNMDIQDRPII